MLLVTTAGFLLLLVLVELRARASRRRDDALQNAMEGLRREIRRAIPLGIELDGETIELDEGTIERIDDLAERLRAGEHPEFRELVFHAAQDSDDDPTTKKVRH